MITDKIVNSDATEQMPLEHFSERAYLEYAMYVILDRALPHIGDGLKPVQRRIIYAMSQLGLKPNTKHKKSARTVGDVLGKFHPHGDSACYEAMVLMAQPFSYRYPLIDGQGNWGAADDPKSFAAMRYTESRLARYADILLVELGQGTVEMLPNFDGTLDEPKNLPARLPNILLNGTTGIAVGMATDIPPHNLREVVAACIHLLDNPKAGEDELCEFIPGPDFPTQAEIITPKEDLLTIYRKGQGTFRMRAVWYGENGDIVITALPHQVSGAKILEQIAAQMQAKKLPMVTDLRDESDHEDPVRLVIVPRSNRVDTETLMAHLFATTDLEKSFRVNMNVIGLDGKPGVLSLKQMLDEWLTFRRRTVTLRLQHRLDKVNDRLHILDGFLIAFLNLDEVIEIIRTEDKPKPVLKKEFGLTDVQAEAILELKLRHLAKIEEFKIEGEQAELAEERDMLEKLLDSPARLKTLIKKELRKDAKTHGDDRRSPIVQRTDAHAISAVDMIPSEPITAILSARGWVRAAKGHETDPVNMNYKAGDKYKASFKGRTNQQAVFIDSAGRSYSLLAHTLPSARGQGEPLSGRFSLTKGADIEAILMGLPDQLVLLSSSAGYGFVALLSDMYSKNKNGKALITLPLDSKPMQPLFIDASKKFMLAAISSEGHTLVFDTSCLPRLSKGKGNKIINIPTDRLKLGLEEMAHIVVFPKGSGLVIHAGKRHLNLSSDGLLDYEGERGRRGKKLPRGLRNVSRVEVILPEQEEPEPESQPEQMPLLPG